MQNLRTAHLLHACRIGIAGVAICGALVVTSGCSIGNGRYEAPANLRPGMESAGPVGPYRLQRGDEIQVRFLFHDDLNATTKIRDDGQVTLAGLGDFHAHELTSSELEADIYRRASLTYRNPEVSVVVAAPAQRLAYIGGEVRRPGYVQVREGLTSLRAIFERGGFRDSAKVDHVLHVRWADDGAYDARVLDLREVLETGDGRFDYVIGVNDVVYVPKTAIANADLWVKQYLTDLIPIREPSSRIDDFGWTQ